MSFSIEQLNSLVRKDFVDAVGWAFEHSPWVAERAWKHRPFHTLTELCARMNAEVASADIDEQLALLLAHPDLGTRAKISPASVDEQSGVGLDRLTPDEYWKLLQLNNAYKEQFGFPFLYAVKGSNKFAILEALERRLKSHPEAEFEEALRQVYRIARLRLETVIAE